MVDRIWMSKPSGSPALSPPASHDLLRQRTRTVTSFCYACNTPWTLTCEWRGGVWVVFCTQRGVVGPARHDLNDLVSEFPTDFFD
jgi:hypothetical protein